MLDPLLEQMHRIRAENAKRHGYNAQAMARAFMRRQASSGHIVVRRPETRVKRGSNSRSVGAGDR